MSDPGPPPTSTPAPRCPSRRAAVRPTHRQAGLPASRARRFPKLGRLVPSLRFGRGDLRSGHRRGRETRAERGSGHRRGRETRAERGSGHRRGRETRAERRSHHPRPPRCATVQPKAPGTHPTIRARRHGRRRARQGSTTRGRSVSYPPSLLARMPPITPSPSAAAPSGVAAFRPSRRSSRSNWRRKARRRRSAKLRRMRGMVRSFGSQSRAFDWPHAGNLVGQAEKPDLRTADEGQGAEDPRRRVHSLRGGLAAVHGAVPQRRKRT